MKQIIKLLENNIVNISNMFFGAYLFIIIVGFNHLSRLVILLAGILIGFKLANFILGNLLKEMTDLNDRILKSWGETIEFTTEVIELNKKIIDKLKKLEKKKKVS